MAKRIALRNGPEVVTELVRDAQLSTGVPPTMRAIAAELGCSPATVIRYMEIAAAKGLLERTDWAADGKRGVSHPYRFPVPHGHCAVCGHLLDTTIRSAA